MLPNFTVVICGAILTVLLLAVAGSGLIEPQTRTRIGAMPEIGRPMMQRMISEPQRGQFAALELSRRGDELMRLRDLAPAVADPALNSEHDDSVQSADEAAAPVPLSPASDAVAPVAVPTGPEAPAAAAEPASPDVAGAVPAEEVLAAEAMPPRDTAGAPAVAEAKLAVEPAVETPPAAPPIAPPAATPEKVAAASSPEVPTVEEHEEPDSELPVPAQLALAEPDAVPAPEAPAKLTPRTGEPEEAAPVRRVMPRLGPFLPRANPVLMQRLPLQPRLAPSAVRFTPLVRRVYKPEIVKAVAPPTRPLHSAVRHVPHRTQHLRVASTVGPYRTYRVTSGAQYR